MLISDPDAVKALFTAPPERGALGGRQLAAGAGMGPSSVLVLTGPEHMRQRKLLLPPFHGERMREYEDVIVEATAARHGRLAARAADAAAQRTRARSRSR